MRLSTISAAAFSLVMVVELAAGCARPERQPPYLWTRSGSCAYGLRQCTSEAVLVEYNDLDDLMRLEEARAAKAKEVPSFLGFPKGGLAMVAIRALTLNAASPENYTFEIKNGLNKPLIRFEGPKARPTFKAGIWEAILSMPIVEAFDDVAQIQVTNIVSREVHVVEIRKNPLYTPIAGEPLLPVKEQLP